MKPNMFCNAWLSAQTFQKVMELLVELISSPEEDENFFSFVSIAFKDLLFANEKINILYV